MIELFRVCGAAGQDVMQLHIHLNTIIEMQRGSGEQEDHYHTYLVCACHCATPKHILCRDVCCCMHMLALQLELHAASQIGGVRLASHVLVWFALAGFNCVSAPLCCLWM